MTVASESDKSLYACPHCSIALERSKLRKQHKDLVRVTISLEKRKSWECRLQNREAKQNMVMQIAARAMQFPTPFTFRDLLEACDFASSNTVHKYFYAWRRKGILVDKGRKVMPRFVSCPSCGGKISLGAVLGSVSTPRKSASIAKARQKYQEICRSEGGKKARIVWEKLLSLQGKPFTIAELHSLCSGVSLTTVRQNCYQWRAEGKVKMLRFSTYQQDMSKNNQSTSCKELPWEVTPGEGA